MPDGASEKEKKEGIGYPGRHGGLASGARAESNAIRHRAANHILLRKKVGIPTEERDSPDDSGS